MLDPKLQRVMRWQWRHLGKFFPMHQSREDWELEYVRDPDILGQISRWSRVAYALLEYMHRHPDADPQTVFVSLNAIVSGQSEKLPRAMRRELLKYADRPDERLSDLNSFTEDGRFIDGGYLE